MDDMEAKENSLYQLCSQLELALSNYEKWKHEVTYGQVKLAWERFKEAWPLAKQFSETQ